MKFKLKELQRLSNSLEQIVQIEIVQKTAYWLGRFRTKINSELERFEENRRNLEKKYGSYKYKNGSETLTLSFKNPEDKHGSWVNDKGEKIESIQINPGQVYWKANSDEDFNLYAKELDGLEENEITIDYNPIKVSELVNGRSEPISIRPVLLSDLESIFTE